MFSIKCAHVIRLFANNANFNFTRFRELRKIVQQFEILPTVESNPTETPTIVSLPNSNPFKSSKLHSPNFNTTPDKPRDLLPSPLDPVEPENAPDLAQNFPPTFNLAAYVNKSETLQQLIRLGVDLSQIEKRKGLAQFILKFDFEKDIKPYLIFLTDLGVPSDKLGEFLTKNPLIFKEDLGDLEVRINYLESKKFRPEQVIRIVTKNPFWLMFSTKRIDQRLGHFQKNFDLRGDDIRFLATKQPRVITYNMEHIRQSTFCIREEMGFDKDEVKCLLLSKPRLWMMNSDELTERFDFVHRKMNISHHQILQCPEVLTCRLFRLKERHGFLKYLGKAQYDPSRDLYVSLRRLVEGIDKEFVIDVAKSSMEEFNVYLKSL